MTIELQTGRTPTRLVTDDYGDERLYRRCHECGAWKLADREHFYPDPRWSAGLIGTCRPCKRAQVNANRAAKRAHPESAGDLQRRQAEACRRWRQRNPDKVREAERRRYHKRRANRAELKRIDYRLQREQQGKMPGHGRPATIEPYRELGAVPVAERLDTTPLRIWLEAVLEEEAHNDVNVSAFCRKLGWQERQLRAIRNGEFACVSLHTADRLLTNYGRPVVIRSRDLERRLVDWAQSLPGNGARLLAYMDRAEAVGHLADVPILFLADLWPELDA